MSASPRKFYEFGPFELDPNLPLLLRGGIPLPLPPKALETLVVLVGQSGRVVTREELIEAVWPDAVVEENNLSVNVSMLRKALGEANGGQKYIETVPRRGYRFTADVREIPVEHRELVFTRHTRSQILIEESSDADSDSVEVERAETVSVSPENSSGSIASTVRVERYLTMLTRLPFVIALVAVAVMLAAGAGLLGSGWQGTDEIASGRTGAASINAANTGMKTLAVLPIRNAAVGDYGARNTSAAGELTDAVIERLAARGNLNLIPTSIVIGAKMTPYNLLTTGRSLNADAVLTGALFNSSADELHVRLHLVSVGGGEVVWAETYKQPRNEWASLLDSIGRNVESGLQKLASNEVYEQRARRFTVNRDAYQLYLQGRFIWDQRHDVVAPNPLSWDEPASSIDRFEDALALDPNFALAHVGLADHYKTAGRSSIGREAEELALKATALDPNLAEPHATLGFIRMFNHWDWAGAEAHFRRAIELDPNCVTAHQWYALFHSLRGNHQEAIKEILRARELAPYSISLMLDSAEMVYHAHSSYYGNFSAAAESLGHALTLHPNSDGIRELLIRCYWMMGSLESATALRNWKRSPQEFARHQAGPRPGSSEFANVLPLEFYHRARWRAWLNDREEALDLLEKAYERRNFFIIFLKADPFFKNLHDEPRYQELLRKLNFTE